MDDIKFDLAAFDPPAIVIPAADPPAPKYELVKSRKFEDTNPRKDKVIRDREILFQILNAADLAQTLYCVKAIPEKCHEVNPLYGSPHPSTGRIILMKSLDGGLHYLITDILRDRGSKLVDVWQITSIAVQGGVVAWNLQFAF